MKWTILCASLFLSGCTAQGQLIYDSAVERVETAVDTANQAALRQLCKNMTRGSYQRLCSGNDKLCEAMDQMCSEWQGQFKNWNEQQ